jgi:hypothetical protein
MSDILMSIGSMALESVSSHDMSVVIVFPFPLSSESRCRLGAVLAEIMLSAEWRTPTRVYVAGCREAMRSLQPIIERLMLASTTAGATA